jgi:hypothetical protein
MFGGLWLRWLGFRVRAHGGFGGVLARRWLFLGLFGNYRLGRALRRLVFALHWLDGRLWLLFLDLNFRLSCLLHPAVR